MAHSLFDKFSNAIAKGAGKPITFALACAGIVAWALAGPFTGFSEIWQLAVNTATTIITFLMVFVVQHTQNRDGDAVQAKLDELILAVKLADNRLIGAERLTGQELRALRDYIDRQAKLDDKEGASKDLPIDRAVQR
ncbi:low affinity iron permease family protein [Devosia sp.]|uniref:low affinity iron permease family protein n=1 Tax=Devosia sp. TaxID=1871048 RepID=UPI003263B359